MLEAAVGRGNIARVIAELDAGWLAERAHQTLTIPQTAFCLLNSNELVIVCSAPDGSPPPRALPSGLARAGLGSFRWRSDGDEYIASYSSFSLKSNFHEASWFVVLSQPSGFALAPLDRSWAIFLPVGMELKPTTSMISRWLYGS